MLIIPIRKGLDPYGFIAKYQGYQGESRTIGEAASAIFKILASNPKTKGKLADVLVGLLLAAKTTEDVERWLGLLKSFYGLPKRHAERLHANAGENAILLETESNLELLNELLRNHGLDEVIQKPKSSVSIDDDIPF